MCSTGEAPGPDSAAEPPADAVMVRWRPGCNSIVVTYAPLKVVMRRMIRGINGARAGG